MLPAMIENTTNEVKQATNDRSEVEEKELQVSNRREGKNDDHLYLSHTLNSDLDVSSSDNLNLKIGDSEATAASLTTTTATATATRLNSSSKRRQRSRHNTNRLVIMEKISNSNHCCSLVVGRRVAGTGCCKLRLNVDRQQQERPTHSLNLYELRRRIRQNSNGLCLRKLTNKRNTHTVDRDDHEDDDDDEIMNQNKVKTKSSQEDKRLLGSSYIDHLRAAGNKLSKNNNNRLPLKLMVVCITITIVILANSALVAEGVDCFKCSSRNGSNPACEDPFHNLNTSKVSSPVLPDPPPNVIFHTPCYAGKKNKEGLFPASACIKLTGTFDTTGETLIVRHCALDSGTLTPDTEIVRMSHCGKFQFEGDLLKGCVSACPEDACNGASPSLDSLAKIMETPLKVGSLLVVLILVSFYQQQQQQQQFGA